MNKLITIVEDEPDIVELVTLHLEKAGFKVKSFPKATEFFIFLDKNVPDLIILDLMLPDVDGLEICKTVKKKDKWEGIPIIMLTAKGEETDKILGLELGADDYITKPFSPKELVARVKAVLRRGNLESKPKKSNLTIGDNITIDSDKCEVKINEKTIELTSTEFKILSLLTSKKGWVFSRDQILDYLWGNEKIVVDRTIDVHIRHLREKLGKASAYIKNIRGFGYKIEE